MSRNSRNRILAALPKREQERLAPHLDPVELELRQELYAPNKAIRYVYFPVSGVMSLVTVMEDGTVTEVGTVGNEGMVGIPILLGAKSAPGMAFSQVPGAGLRMPVEVLREEVKRGGPLIELLQRYTQVLFNQIAQSVSCGRVHAIQRRAARWLLMTHDRVGGDELLLTQEFLGQMLGVRRAAAGAVAAEMQAQGLIEYTRGKITITSRRGLEKVACECYRIIRNEYDRLLS